MAKNEIIYNGGLYTWAICQKKFEIFSFKLKMRKVIAWRQNVDQLNDNNALLIRRHVKCKKNPQNKSHARNPKYSLGMTIVNKEY